MNFKCIKDGGFNVKQGEIYVGVISHGLINKAAIAATEVFIVIFNDKREWCVYPAFMFEPA